MLAEAPGVKNFFEAGGMCSVGIDSAAGVGKVLAELIVEGAHPYDLWVVENVWLFYAPWWHHRQIESSRVVRCSPFYDRLAVHDAGFGMSCGWEQVNWLVTEGMKPAYEYGWDRQN